jgi:ABC-type methionine transport system ATPase subunit
MLPTPRTHQARVTLARAVYSSAQVVLLDDILSALDVHTSQWIVDKCLGGDLLKGRTVLLVTHNILLSRKVADYIVVLGLDGTIKNQGPIEEVLKRDRTLQVELAKEEEEIDQGEKKEDQKDDEETTKAKTAAGKLVVEEEVAIGRVAWSTCKPFDLTPVGQLNGNIVDRMFIDALGGKLFFVRIIVSLTIQMCFPIISKAFLAYWAQQYEERPQEDVPVRLLVFRRTK